VTELVAHVPGATFADGSVCDVQLWLSSEPAPEADVFAAMVVLRDREGRCAVTWSPRRQEWGIPGGLREPGESVVACALREVQEETALRLRAQDLAVVGFERFAPRSPGRWPAAGGCMQLFSADLDRSGPALTASEPDAVDPQWLTAGEFAARSGERFWWPLVAAALAEDRRSSGE
jgi:ADP-ribose pyrophosphatase YjhB (NUDIX family)